MPDFDTSVPTLGENGWYKVFEDDFNGDGLNQNIDFGERYSGSKEIWTTSPHAIRWESNDEKHPEYACWWCPEMVEIRDSNLIVRSEYGMITSARATVRRPADLPAALRPAE